MPPTSNRLDKVADQLKKELAMMIQNEIRDPRIGMVSVTAVRVSRDLAHGEVYVTIMGKETAEEAAEAIEALNKAGGYLRNLLAKSLNLRTTPHLKFRFDESVNRGAYLSGLIDKALEEDSKHSPE